MSRASGSLFISAISAWAKAAVLLIERDTDWPYKPHLVALDNDGQIEFWGAYGAISLRKILWLAEHSRAGRIVFLKLGADAKQFVDLFAEW